MPQRMPLSIMNELSLQETSDYHLWCEAKLQMNMFEIFRKLAVFSVTADESV